MAPRSRETITSSAAKVRVVTGEQLAETGERSLPRALAQTAGVWIQESNLGGGAPLIRGLFGNQILIMVDGVRVNNSTTRFGPNQSLNTIPTAWVERVEIIHGSSSVLYGSDAIGGVVAIWTRRRSAAGEAGDTNLHGDTELLFDSATEGWRASQSFSGATSSVGWLAILGGQDFDDLRAGEGLDQPFTGYRSTSGFGSVDVALTEGRTLRAMYSVNRDFDVPRTFLVVPGFGQTEPSFAQFDFALQERERTVLSFDDSTPGGFADSLQVRLSARRYTERRVRRRTGSTARVSGENQVETLGIGAGWRKHLGEHHLLTWGFDVDDDDVDSTNVATDINTSVSTRIDGDFAPNARYTSAGVFVQDEYTALAPTLLTFGLRYSYFDFAFDGDGVRERGDFSQLTASLEAARDLTDEVRLTGTIAQGFQAPNLEDLANDGDFAGGTEIANPDLEAANSLMAEVALDVETSRWSGTAAVFATRIDDYIGRRLLDEGLPGVAGDETFMRENAGRVDLYGLELAGRTRLGPSGSPWSLEAVASWVRGRQRDSTLDPNTGEAPLDGVEARRVPPLNGRLTLRWQDQRAETRWYDEAHVSLQWATDQDQLNPDDLTDPRIDPTGTDGWVTVQLGASGPIGENIRWHATLVNVFDELYRVHGSGVDGPGRSVVVGLRASF